MAYFHVDRARAYLESLGFTTILNRPIRVRANVDADDNSYYDPATGEMGLGAGGTDDGEDADVIVHEYGHAIQDDQVRNFGATPEGGAMGEGFGDYLAAAMSLAVTPNEEAAVCLAEWDALGFARPENCLRRLDRDPSVEQVNAPPCSGEVHCAGEAWSAALWDIRAALGGAVADRLVIQSHFSLTAISGFQEGSRALLAADQAVSGGANQAFLRSLLASRGLLDLERLDDTPSDATPLGIPGQAGGQVDGARDPHDVFRLELVAGRGVIVRATGTADVDLRLYAPGTTSLESGSVVGGSTTPGSGAESFAYRAGAGGTYFLDVAARTGAGTYTLETLSDLDGDTRPDNADNCPSLANFGQENRDGDANGDVCDPFPDDPANDVDRDGRGANTDNCPAVANPGQADWDRDRQGDACDRSSRVTVERLTVRRRTLTVTGTARPVDAEPSAWRLLVTRRICHGKRCRFVSEGERSGARRIGEGRLRLSVRLRRKGVYRVRIVLRDARYSVATSAFRQILIRR